MSERGLAERIRNLERQIAMTRYSSLQDKETPDRTIAVRYTSNSGQVIVNNTMSIINYSGKVYDPFSCVTVGASWAYVAQIKCYLTIVAAILYDASTEWTLTEEATLALYKNNVIINLLDRKDNFTSVAYAQYVALHGMDIVEAIPGDSFNIRTIQKSGNNIALNNDAKANYVCILANRYG